MRASPLIILEKAAESSEATFVAPRWLTRKHCDCQMANIKFWKDARGISEAEAQKLRSAVETLRAAIRDDVPPSSASSPSSPSSPGSASPSAPPAQAESGNQAAERNPNQLPSLKGAKVAPLSVDSEGQAELNPGQPLPPIGTAVAAPPAGRQAPGWALSRAESLGVPAASINRRRSTAAAGAGLTPMVLALELAVVLRESTRTKEAVEEWWDVNMALFADANSECTLLVALMEELQPAMLLARIFVRVSQLERQALAMRSGRRKRVFNSRANKHRQRTHAKERTHNGGIEHHLYIRTKEPVHTHTHTRDRALSSARPAKKATSPLPPNLSCHMRILRPRPDLGLGRQSPSATGDQQRAQ